MAASGAWFKDLVGFEETTGDEVRSRLTVDGDKLTSQANERTLTCGTLTTPSLAELPAAAGVVSGGLSVREVLADAQDLHGDPGNADALFQVASQFNLLEMVSPGVTPEKGVTGYVNDHTQGPACAVACGAGTIYRNWLVPVDGAIGQSASHQIDCLADLGAALDNTGERLWAMQNGYAMASADGLTEIGNRLAAMSSSERDELMGRLRIGVHSDTEVTLPGAGHLVTQAYCSAVPVSYSRLGRSDWEPFARLVLDAAYEATLLAGLANAERTGNKSVFLTSLGGGAFGNDDTWIFEAMERAFDRYSDADLDVAIVSYRRPNPAVQLLLRSRSSRSADAHTATSTTETTMQDLPIAPLPRSFALTPSIYGGVYPGGLTKDEATEKLHALLGAGITTIVDLTEAGEPARGGEPLKPYEELMSKIGPAHRVPIPIKDGGVGSSEDVQAAIDAIDHAIADGGKVYVHCWGGKGRTGLVLGCYLARSVGPEAVDLLNEIRGPQMRHPKDQEPVPETPPQRRAIEAWPQDTEKVGDLLSEAIGRAFLLGERAFMKDGILDRAQRRRAISDDSLAVLHHIARLHASGPMSAEVRLRADAIENGPVVNH